MFVAYAAGRRNDDKREENESKTECTLTQMWRCLYTYHFLDRSLPRG